MDAGVKPINIRAGAVRIPIHEHSQGGYQARFIDEQGRSVRWTSLDLGKLKERCRKKAQQMQKGVIDLSKLTEDQVAVCREVVRRGLTLTDLETVATVKRVSVSYAVQRLLEAKADTSTNNIRTLRTHLNQFAKDYGERPITSIETEEIDQFLRKTPALRTRRNKRASIVTLWRWSRDKEWLPQSQRTAAERTDSPSLRKQKRLHHIETWSPAELKTILQSVPHSHLNWIVLSAFCGVRTLELFPDEKDPKNRKEILQWEHIRLTGKEPRLLVPAAVSKTAEKRSVPIPKAAKAWLMKTRNRTGPVCPVAVPWKGMKSRGGRSVINDLEAALGQSWKRNALRHSFGTYSVIQTGGVAGVAIFMGNSERVVKQSYYDVGRSKKESLAWFALVPGAVDRALQAAG